MRNNTSRPSHSFTIHQPLVLSCVIGYRDEGFYGRESVLPSKSCCQLQVLHSSPAESSHKAVSRSSLKGRKTAQYKHACSSTEPPPVPGKAPWYRARQWDVCCAGGALKTQGWKPLLEGSSDICKSKCQSPEACQDWFKVRDVGTKIRVSTF